MRALPAHCAIDFGTSNSAVAIAGAGGTPRLVVLEAASARCRPRVFYRPMAQGSSRAYGQQAAIAAYVDGIDGRLMRSMKSILGSDLMERRTDVGGSHAGSTSDVVAGYLKHLKRLPRSARRADHARRARTTGVLRRRRPGAGRARRRSSRSRLRAPLGSRRRRSSTSRSPRPSTSRARSIASRSTRRRHIGGGASSDLGRGSHRSARAPPSERKGSRHPG